MILTAEGVVDGACSISQWAFRTAPTCFPRSGASRSLLFMDGWAFPPTSGYTTLKAFRRMTSHLDGAYWVRKFPLNASGGVALSELVGDWESVQVLRFISGADPDPRFFAAGAASTTAPASSTTTSAPVDASVEDFPEPVQSLVWRCRGLCMDCKKACCGKSDEDYAKVKWHRNHRCNYYWTVWKAEHR